MLRKVLGSLLLVLLLCSLEAAWIGKLAFAVEAGGEVAESVDDPPAVNEEADGPRDASDEEEEMPPADDGASAAEETAEGDTAASDDTEPTVGDDTESEADRLRTVITESLLQIVIRDRNDEVRRVGSGFVVADELVLTAAHVVADERRIVAVSLITGAEQLARVVALEEVADAALLRVIGLDLAPLTFGKDGFSPGRAVVSAGVWGQVGESYLVTSAEDDLVAAFAEGAVGRLEPLAERGPDLELIEHNAMIPVAGYGGPLLNDCGEVIGVNRGTPGVSRARLRRGLAPEVVVSASGVAAIIAAFRDADVTFAVSDDSCVDARERAAAAAEEARRRAEEEQAAAERAREELEEERARAQESASEAEEVQAELDAAKARLEELERQARELERQTEEREGSDEEAEAVQEALEVERAEVARLEAERIALEEQRQASQQRLTTTIVVSFAAVALILLLSVVIYRRRLQHVRIAQEPATQVAGQPTGNAWAGRMQDVRPAYVLTGNTSNGQAVSLTVTVGQLEAGVVIGRHPQRAGVVIADSTLSREHAKLSYSEQTGGRPRLRVQDLGTTNGTLINGRELSRGGEAVLDVGDTLELGGVVLQIRDA